MKRLIRASTGEDNRLRLCFYRHVILKFVLSLVPAKMIDVRRGRKEGIVSLMARNALHTISLLAIVSINMSVLGCTEQVLIQYTPSGAAAPAGAEMRKSIRIEPVKDQRTSETLATTPGLPGSYVVAGNPAEVITDGIRAELKDHGYRIVEQDGDYVLYGDLLLLEVILDPGLINETANARAQMSITLRDSRANVVVWTDTIIGKSSVTRAFAGDPKETINLAVADLIQKLVNSESLRAAIR